MNGHGAEGLLKFRDNAELTSAQLATGLLAASAAGRFARALLVLDTCHAESILQHIPAAAAHKTHTLPGSSGGFAEQLQDDVQLLGVCSDNVAVLCSAATWMSDTLPQSLQWLGSALKRFVVHWVQQWDPPSSVPVPPLGIDIVATSSWEASSYAAGFDGTLGTPLADGFVTTLFRRTLSPARTRRGSKQEQLSASLDKSLLPPRSQLSSKSATSQSPAAWQQSAARYFMQLPPLEVGSKCVRRSDHGAGAGMASLSLEEALAQSAVLRATRNNQATAPA